MILGMIATLVLFLVAALVVWLGAIVVPNEGEVECLRRILFGRGGTITAATNASPSVLTAGTPSTPPPAGSLIVITGATGNTAINTTAIVYNVSGSTFSIATVNATTGATTPVNGNGVFGGTCVWSLAGMEDIVLKLYKTNVTPAETDTVASYTVADFTNYANKTLTSQRATTAWADAASGAPTSSWSAEASVAESTYVAQSWSPGSPQTIYGYWLEGAVSAKLYGAELFSSSKNLVSGDTLTLTPRLGAA